MRRPFALVGFTYLLAQLAAVFLGEPWSLAAACALLFLMAAVLLHPRLRTSIFPVALCAASLAFGGFAALAPEVTAVGIPLDGTDKTIVGTLEEAPYPSYDKRYCTVRVESVDGVPTFLRVRLSVPQTFAGEAGAQLKGRAHFYLPPGGDGFSSRNSYAADGIAICAYLYGYEPYTVKAPPPEGKSIWDHIQDLRASLADAADFLLPDEEAGVLRSVLLGDKSGLSSELASDFRTVGLAHLTAVSGLHMTTVSNLLLACLVALRLPRRLSAVLTSAGVILFMTVVDFVPSASRSGAMCLLYLAGIVVSRRADSLNSLGFAVLALCLASPFAAADIRLLLSFSTTLGLILLSRPLCIWLNAWIPGEGHVKKLFHGFNVVFSTSISATLFTLPVVVLCFRGVSAVALLANLLALWPTTFMLQFGLGAVLLQVLLPHTLAALPLALPAGWLAKYLCGCVRLLARIPHASLPLYAGFVLLWLAATLLLLAFCICSKNPKRLMRTAAWLSVILFLAGMLSYQVSCRNVTRVTVADTGSGLSVAVSRNGHAAVIGFEGNYPAALAEELRSQAVETLDCVLLFSSFGEEARNTSMLVQEFPTDQLVLPSGYVDEFLRQAPDRTGELLPYRDKVHRRLWDNIEIETEAGAAFLEADGVTVLLVPSGEAIGELPVSWRTPDFAVLAQEVDGLSPACIILAMEEQDVKEQITGIQNGTATAGTGNVTIEITGERACRIRRER